MDFAEEIKRDSDRICNLILYCDYQWVDIAIEMEKMREKCAALFPHKTDLFEHLYASRFQRLWNQWREPQIYPDSL